ncbi:MAG: peptidoglycan-binding protein [Gammaproteobacteria bacterium]
MTNTQTPRPTARAVVIGVCAIALAACGSMPEERAVSGAGIGAGAGAALGAVTGMSVATGALIGAAAGGLTGALTNDRQVNLGQPAWKQGRQQHATAAPAGYPQPAYDNVVAAIQNDLNRLGYAAGAADGVIGPRTSEAIRRYQRDHNLLIDGRATPELVDHIQSLGRPLARNPG